MDETNEPTTGGAPTATAEEPAPTSPLPPAGYRRLIRRPDRGMIGGVAAGLGEYFGVDPLVFRVGFVIAVLAGGLGLVAYLLLWWLVPAHDSTDDPQERVRTWFRGLPTWLGVALLIAGAAAVSQGFGIWHPAIFWGVVLIGLGVLLFAHRPDLEGEPRRAPAGRFAPPEPAPAPDPSTGPATAWTGPVPLPPPGKASVHHDRLPRQRRERSALGWITMGVVLLAIGVAALLDTTNAVAMSPVRYLALVLTVLGVGLAIGARWGRARWLLIPAILLLPLVLAASFIDVPVQGGFGGRFFRPGSVAEIAPTYRLAAGELTLDLRDVDVPPGSTSITVTVAAGDLRVMVPADAALVVDATSGAGVVDLFHRPIGGVRVRVDRTFTPTNAPGTYVLHLHTGLGRVALVHDLAVVGE